MMLQNLPDIIQAEKNIRLSNNEDITYLFHSNHPNLEFPKNKFEKKSSNYEKIKVDDTLLNIQNDFEKQFGNYKNFKTPWYGWIYYMILFSLKIYCGIYWYMCVDRYYRCIYGCFFGFF